MNKMRVVIYGAGNIGRGFLARLIHESGFEITFIDITASLVEALNIEKEYPVRLLFPAGQKDIIINNFIAINGGDTKAVIKAIADAALVFTAVGTRELQAIAPLIAKGIVKNLSREAKPLDIIICENLIDADQVLEKLIEKELSCCKINPKAMELFRQKTGLIKATIACMVPIQTDIMKHGNPLRICTEDYSILPVEKKAFKGEIPNIKGMEAHDNFDFYIERKFFIHNMGHSTCAYLGLYYGHKFIFESIKDENILLICENAMLESAVMLAQKYKVPIKDIYLHVQDLIKRFSNKALMDTCQRVGADTTRKLGPHDRFMAAIRCCEEINVKPFYITKGAAAALYHHIRENKLAQTENAAGKILEEISGLGKNSESHKLIISEYSVLLKKTING